MTTRPLVTIVTPTKDQAAFIGETIASVRAQTYAPIEHIVVDGGSSDGTLSLLQQFAGHPGFRWVTGQDDGMYDAVEKGFAMGAGDILAYLNSDDLYFPWSVEVAVASLARGFDLVYGDAVLLDDETRLLRPHLQLPLRREFLLSIGSFAQPATWWTRDLHERLGGFDRTLRSAGDLDFYIRASAMGRVGRIEEFLAVMRLHADMQTRSQAARIREENHRVRRRAVASATDSTTGATGPSASRERIRAWALRRRAWLRLMWYGRRPADVGLAWRQARTVGGLRTQLVDATLGQLPVVGAARQFGSISLELPVGSQPTPPKQP